MHTQILDAYASDEDEFHSFEESEEDTNSEMRVPNAGSRRHATSLAPLSVSPLKEQLEGDFEIETPVMRQDED